MNRLIITTALCVFAFASYGACMTDKVNAVNDKLKMSQAAENVKAEVMKLRDLGVENEHSNAQLATKYFEDALNLLN